MGEEEARGSDGEGDEEVMDQNPTGERADREVNLGADFETIYSWRAHSGAGGNGRCEEGGQGEEEHLQGSVFSSDHYHYNYHRIVWMAISAKMSISMRMMCKEMMMLMRTRMMMSTMRSPNLPAMVPLLET